MQDHVRYCLKKYNVRFNSRTFKILMALVVKIFNQDLNKQVREDLFLIAYDFSSYEISKDFTLDFGLKSFESKIVNL